LPASGSLITSKSVVVTGGAGFIGSHLVDRLVSEGNEVTVIDNLVNGKRANLRDALKTGHVQLVEADIVNFDDIRPYFDNAFCVFHLAALADIVPSVEHPLRYHAVNVDGTAAVMESARLAGVKRVVYAASASCYGIPDVFPTPETQATKPEYPYALTKLLGEQIVLHWGEIYGVEVVSLRMFNVYGPRSRTTGTYGAVLGVFLAQRLADNPLTIVGDGSQTRDFTYVSDVADAFITAASSDENGEIFNVGSGGTYSVSRLAELIGGETIQIPERPGEPACTLADISKIGDAMGWSPRVSFEEGIRKVLDNIEDWRNAPVWTPETIEDATKAWFDNLAERPAT
jgi:UDP-glucose 4-epimerase